MEKIWLDTIDFENYGGWQRETQFVREMGQPYLIANDVPGVPVADASTSFETTESGYYRIFVRTKNWKLPEAPGKFKVSVDDNELENLCGKMPTPSWYWEIAGDIYIEKGVHKLSLRDKTGWLSRCAAVVVTNDFDFVPSPEKTRLLKQRCEIKGICDKVTYMGEWDLIVVGAGPGGVAAAVSGARQGLKTALLCGRPYVGGNASDEGSIGPDGAGGKNSGFHETGIANEIKRICEKNKSTWQSAMEVLLAQNPHVTVFANTLCTDAITEDGKIKSIEAVNTMTLEKYSFAGDMFADCSGDGWLGYYAGAAYRLGREAKHEYNEEFAPQSPDTLTMSGCLCMSRLGWYMRGFYMEKTEEEAIFDVPDWIPELPEGTEKERPQAKSHCAEWWLENSNDYDDLWEEEFARDALICLGIGYFNWLKTKSPQRDEFKNHKLTHLALHNSKRENRRLIGDYVLSQTDITERTSFDDVVTYHGWGIDVHHPKGIFSGKEGPFHLNMEVPPLPVPYRCLYSKNIENLFMASRCSSVSHLALGTTRIENTIMTFGQVVGIAAAMCKKYGNTPRGIYQNYIKELQQNLLKDDLTILELVNEDSADMARNAEISATSEDVEKGGFAKNILNGKNRSVPGECNGWISKVGLPQSVSLKWNAPINVSMVQITAETDLVYPRYSFEDAPPFDYTAKKLAIEIIRDGKCVEKREISDNYLRQMREEFDDLIADEVKITVTETSGKEVAVLNEIRVY